MVVVNACVKNRCVTSYDFKFLLLFLILVSFPLQTWMNWMSIAFSIALFFTVALCYNASCPACYSPSNPYWTMQRLLQEPLFYLLCFITPIAALLPRYTVFSLWMSENTSLFFKYL